MKAFIIITTTICAGLFWAATAGAQMSDGHTGRMPIADQTMAHRMMHDHMQSMAQMMSEMASAMQHGKMTPAQQKQCSRFVQHLSDMMHDMAADPQQARAIKRGRDLQAVEEEWSYFKDQNRSLYGH